MMETYQYILIICAISLIVITILSCINEIKYTLREKRKMYKREYNKTFSDKIDTTNKFLDLIDSMINIEIAKVMRSYAALQQKYEVINMDKDLESISNSVFEGIKKEYFTNEDNVLTDDYIMKYISQQSMIIFMINIHDFNTTILTQNREM